MQINIYRQSLLDALVKANAGFYGQFGYLPGTDGALLINTTEYEQKFLRKDGSLRAYELLLHLLKRNGRS